MKRECIMPPHAAILTRSVLLGVLLLAVCGVAGCSNKGPKTYPVSGKVVFEKGGNLNKLVGSSVELQSTTEPNTRGFGQIQPDGSFSISTYRQGDSLPGAMEGTHKARLMIDMGDEDNARPKKKWPIDPKYTRFESSGWEITVPTTGEVILKLP
jgi:hypothetical protein